MYDDDDNELVMLVSLLQDSNPIFLFSKQHIESASPPSTAASYVAGWCWWFTAFSLCLSFTLFVTVIDVNYSCGWGIHLTLLLEVFTHRNFVATFM